MSLSNLKKSKSTNKRTPITVDEFIDDAVVYAAGGVETTSGNSGDVLAFPGSAHEEKPMRRATFTLSEECIKSLTYLSHKTGIPKSRLIRIWIEDQIKRGEHTNLEISKTT